MELDEFKKTGHDRPSPATHGDGHRLDALIKDLKEQDVLMRKKIRLFSIIYIVFIGLYSAILTTQDNEVMKLGYSLLVLGFMLIIGYFSYLFMRVVKIDYSAPMIQFIKKALKRYAFMTVTDWLIVIPLLLVIGTGGMIIVWGSFSKYDPRPYLAAGIYLAVFLVAVTIGFWAGIKDWHKSNGNLYRRLQNLQAELK